MTRTVFLVAALILSTTPGCALYLSSREGGVKARHLAGGAAIDVGLVAVTALALEASASSIDPQDELGFWGNVGIAAGVVLVAELLTAAVANPDR